MTPTTPKPRITQADIAYWMGQVDGKLESMHEKMEGIIKRLDNIEEKQDDHANKAATNGHKGANAPQDAPAMSDNEKKNITFYWLIDKLAVPLGLAFLYWFLFQILPRIAGG